MVFPEEDRPKTQEDMIESLRKGDIILAIDGVTIKGLPFEEVDKKINVPREDEKYNRPFVNDYQLELAKDILSCLPPKELFMTIPKSSQ